MWLRIKWLFSTCVVFLILFINPVHAQVTTVTSPNFNTYFKLSGSASVASPTSKLTLTPAINFQTGFAHSRIQLDFTSDFTIDLSWFMGASDAGADGTLFALHNNASKELANTGNPTSSIAYRYDTYQNAGDPVCSVSGDFWTFISNGTWLTSTCFGSNVEDNANHSCIIKWVASTKQLTMSWDGVTVDTRTVTNIATILNGNRAILAFLGFTGGASNLQQVTINSITGNLPPVLTLDADRSTLASAVWNYKGVVERNVAAKINDSDLWGNSFANFSGGQRVTATITIPSALSSESLTALTLPSGVVATSSSSAGNSILTLSNIASNADIANAINAVRYTITSATDMASLNYSRNINIQLSDALGNSDLVTAELSMLSPGGVGVGYLGWFRGDNTSNTASVWKEQNSTNNATIDIGTPVLNTSTTDLLNFNGTYTMNSAIMNLPAALDVGGNGQPYSFFGVAKLKTTPGARVFSSEISNNLFGYHNGNENTIQINGTPSFLTLGSNNVIASTLNLNQFSLNRTAAEAIVQRKNGIQINSNASSDDNSWRVSLGGLGVSNDETSNVIIGEFISYNTDNTSNINRIESYLATKYGISRNDGTGLNYIASDNATTYWDATANSGSNNDVFGIGRDDATILHQRISKSANTDDFVILSTNNDFSARNTSANHTDIAQNLSFLMIGNDDGSANVQFTELETSIYNGRIGREWKVQKTNFSQTVNLEFTGWGSNSRRTVFLIKKNANSNFSSGTTQVGSLDANGRITGVTLSNNDFFTLALDQKAPGGVLNGLKLWYRADLGTSTTTHGATVSTWQNQMDGVNATAVGTPLFQSTASTVANFNPTVFLDNSDALERFNIGGTTPNQINSSIFAAGMPGLKSASISDIRTVLRSNSSELDFQMLVNTNNFVSFLDRQPSNLEVPSSVTWNEGELALVNGFIPSGSSALQYSKNGSSVVATSTATIDGGGKYDLLGGDNVSTRPFGRLADAIVYGINTLSSSEIGRINAYLAIKYGISLNDGTGASYLAGDGTTTYWDSSTNTGYNNDVFGIGRDDRSNLQQKQSISINATSSDLRFTIFLGDFTAGSFPVTNSGNSNSFSANNSYMLVGNDNASISSFVNNAETPVKTIYKLPREWKVQETGTVGTITIVVPVSAMPTGGLPSTLKQNYTLLVSNSSDFTNASVLPMTKVGTDFVVAVDFSNAQFFSFGYGDNIKYMRHGKSVKNGERNPMKF
ncbi:lectin-like domain-containing protein [Nubsella zeaxanthinifaciens]|uniref:lectin-like domain-containing protein n=1 Tax=Nubsella zeaxanthinifaciens TaxID=392412 RepID=UPI000DE40129|nr:hypothetical protein [Nubsella zeaxanthinifaciens]